MSIFTINNAVCALLKTNVNWIKFNCCYGDSLVVFNQYSVLYRQLRYSDPQYRFFKFWYVWEGGSLEIMVMDILACRFGAAETC